MITENLHRKAVGVDRDQHRDWKLKHGTGDWRIASRINSVFVAATEFADASHDYALLFIRAGNDPQGQPQIAPVAALGLSPQENLYLDGSRWRAEYQPALLRAYPFAIARIDGQRFAVCMDAEFEGFSQSEGQPLFNADGTPAPLLQQVQKQLELFEVEIQRTRQFGRTLLQKGLLRDMRFDATLPDGSKLGVDGFLTVDEEKLKALPDADVLELHRNGMLGLIHAHQISLGNMRRLVQWRMERAAAPPAAVPPA